MEFWTEPQMTSIHKMLNPGSIAIVGATPRMQYGGRFLAAALKAKDRVRVYAVNPRYDEIMGVKSYPSVTDLPEAPTWWASWCPTTRCSMSSRGATARGRIGDRDLGGLCRARRRRPA